MIGSFINPANFKSTLPRIPNRFYEPLKLKNWMYVHFRISVTYVIVGSLFMQILEYWSTHIIRHQNDLL